LSRGASARPVRPRRLLPLTTSELRLMKRILCSAFAAAVLSMAGAACAAVIDLGGPATGYLAVSNYKNSVSQAGIEGAGNGLPGYPNYAIPAGQANAGRWTA